MGDSSSEFMLNIQQTMSGASVVSELASLQDSIAGSIDKLRDFEAAQVDAQRGLDKVAGQMATVRQRMADAMSEGNERAFWKQAAALEVLVKREQDLKAAATAAKAAFDAEAASVRAAADKFETLKKEEDDAKKSVESLKKGGKGLGDLGGPVGALAQKIGGRGGLVDAWEDLKGSMGTADAAGAVAISVEVMLAAAIATVVAVVLAATLATAAWAVTLADTARTQHLLAAGIEGTVAGGEALDRKLGDLTKRLPLTRDELSSMATDLRKAGYQGDELAAQLEKAGIKAAQAKFGPEWESEMLSLNQQSKVLRQNIGELFGGLHIEPVLEGMARLVGLLDANSESGKAIKAVFEAIFQPLLDSSTDVFPQVERFVLGVEVGVLELAIGIKNLAKQFDLTVGPMGDFVDLGTVGEYALYGLVAVLGLLTLAMGAIAVLGALMFVPLIVTLAVLMLPIAAVIALVYGLYEAFDYLTTSFDWAAIGKSIVDGLLGPLADPGAIADKVNEFGKNIVSGVKGVLEIGSPSRVMYGLGGNTVDGYVNAIDDGAGEVTAALEGMVAPPKVQGGAPAKGGGAAANLAGAVFNFYGVKDAEDAIDKLEHGIGEVLERAGLAIGANGGDEPAPA